MQFAQTIDGSAPVLKKFQVGSDCAANTPITACASAGDVGGAIPATFEAAISTLGVSEDAATYATAQIPGGGDPAGVVTVIVNPGAMYRAPLYGGATSATPILTAVCTTDQTNGLTVVASAVNFASPQMDSGFIFGYSGANAGHRRKIITTSTVTATVVTAFPNNSLAADADEYLYGNVCGIHADADQFVTLTTDLVGVNGGVAVDVGNDNFRVIEFDLRTSGEDGANSSSVLLMAYDHAFANGHA